jgi:hypothetical protein
VIIYYYYNSGCNKARQGKAGQGYIYRDDDEEEELEN